MPTGNFENGHLSGIISAGARSQRQPRVKNFYAELSARTNSPGLFGTTCLSMIADASSLRGRFLVGKENSWEGKESSSSVNSKQSGRVGNFFIVILGHQEKSSLRGWEHLLTTPLFRARLGCQAQTSSEGPCVGDTHHGNREDQQFERDANFEEVGEPVPTRTVHHEVRLVTNRRGET